MLTNREKMILEEVKGSEDTSSNIIELDIQDSFYSELKVAAENKGISVNDFFLISIIEKIISEKKIEVSKVHYDKVIIDIFDLHRIEEIIKELEVNNQVAIIVNLKNDQYPVLIPIEQYNNIQKFLTRS